MAKIAKKIKKNAPPPEGYTKIEPTLKKLQGRLKDAQTNQNAADKTKSKTQALWPIYQINHQISRYVYDMYYKKKLISRELYDWLLLQNYVNADLIAKWKKQGYENLCCVHCILIADKNHKNPCVCRVPKAKLVENNESDEKVKNLQCITCGCKGCASTD
ncbi:G10 protein [Scheffersomyces xylosifermentans]|uniref:G10 protein n=1 Tax=Scheffersomyces xylosifermentans TaxID=1304137 RepID=UPI00315C663B